MKYDKVISYDANFSINKHRGMGKYINSFVQVLNNKYNYKPLGLLKKDNLCNNEDYFSFGFANYIAWEQLSLLKYRNQSKGPMIFPYNTAPLFLKESPDNILILHDVIFLNRSPTKSLKQKIGQLYRSFIVPVIVHKFQHIITVSEYSKNQIIQRLKVSPEKIDVIPNSVSLTDNFENENPDFEDRDNVIFHIGGEPDYKNSKMLLYAFAGLPISIKENYRLKMIGIRDLKTLNEYRTIAEQLNIIDNIIFLDYQTDLEIKELYQNSKLFIFPSKEEGFGIPIIEAMKYGCSLICSNASCLPEIAGEGAVYFDPNDQISLINAITSTLDDKKAIETRILQGYEQVKKYSFEAFEQKIIFWYKNRFKL